eukprot:m.343117 g.343117  ORF g.343117 m.343117 type:complete len:188 (-) comp22388_c0_seq1:31-594(-)
MLCKEAAEAAVQRKNQVNEPTAASLKVRRFRRRERVLDRPLNHLPQVEKKLDSLVQEILELRRNNENLYIKNDNAPQDLPSIEALDLAECIRNTTSWPHSMIHNFHSEPDVSKLTRKSRSDGDPYQSTNGVSITIDQQVDLSNEPSEIMKDLDTDDEESMFCTGCCLPVTKSRGRRLSRIQSDPTCY